MGSRVGVVGVGIDSHVKILKSESVLGNLMINFTLGVSVLTQEVLLFSGVSSKVLSEESSVRDG